MSKATGNRTFNLGDRSIKLRFSILALAELEERWGCKGIGEVMNRVANPGARDLIDLFYAITRSHHPEIEHAECAQMLDEAGLGGITQAMIGAVEDSADDQAAEGAPGKGTGESEGT